ncbi:unnamed protein product [Ostreobium quekettii]|uniref:Uncharacterized protein n=1 Tax=Ostreobium quekettii TaxID=121088 RepID=A0A8S1J5T5_9CHLO|nr:unnamed protein product [Ostreobium quekettii]|eukprot:evm.model.scf_911.3 EVM.evm.TU.scf_911.3   scf_911:17758-27890(+)
MASFGVGERFQGSASSTPGPGAYTPRTKDGLHPFAIPELKKGGLRSARRSSGSFQDAAEKKAAGPFSARHRRTCSHDSAFSAFSNRTTPRGTDCETMNPPHEKIASIEKKPHSGVRQLSRIRQEKKGVQDKLSEPSNHSSKIPPRRIAVVGSQLGTRASALQSTVDSVCCQASEIEARRAALRNNSCQSSSLLLDSQAPLPQVTVQAGKPQSMGHAEPAESKRVQELERELSRQRAALKAANDEICRFKAILSARDDAIGQLKGWLSRAQQIQQECQQQFLASQSSALTMPSENNCRSEDSSPVAYASEASTRIEGTEDDRLLAEPNDDQEESQELDHKSSAADTKVSAQARAADNVKAARLRNVVRTSFTIVSSLAEQMGTTEVLAAESLLADAVALSDCLEQAFSRQRNESSSSPNGTACTNADSGVSGLTGVACESRTTQQSGQLCVGHDNHSECRQFHARQKQELEELHKDVSVLLREKFKLEQCIRYLAARCQLYQGYCVGEDVSGQGAQRAAQETRPGSAQSSGSSSVASKSRKTIGRGVAAKRRSTGCKKKLTVSESAMQELQMEALKDAGIRLDDMEEMRGTDPFEDLSWQQDEESRLYDFSHPPGKNERRILAKVSAVCIPSHGDEHVRTTNVSYLC